MQSVWFFTLIGVAVFWGVSWNAEWRSDFDTIDDLTPIEARLLAMDPTKLSMHGERVHRVVYEYKVNGVFYSGASYHDGTIFDPRKPLAIHYSAADPAVSRADGMRAYLFGAWTGYLGLIALLGCTILAFGVRSGVRDVRILREGRAAMGTWMDSHDTAVKVFGVTRMEVHIAFTDHRDVERVGVIKTFKSEQAEDDHRERLLYDPDQPERIVLIDTLPGRVDIDHRGRLRAAGWSLPYLILPTATVGLMLMFVFKEVF